MSELYRCHQGGPGDGRLLGSGTRGGSCRRSTRAPERTEDLGTARAGCLSVDSSAFGVASKDVPTWSASGAIATINALALNGTIRSRGHEDFMFNIVENAICCFSTRSFGAPPSASTVSDFVHTSVAKTS